MSLLRIIAKSQTLLRSTRCFHNTPSNFARVLATDGIDELCVKIFQDRGHHVDLLKTMPQDQLVKVIGEYDGLVVRSATKVTPELLKHATKLRIVGRAGVGVDNININEATKYGVLVMNTPDGNTVSTAQLAMSLLTNLARHIPQANMSVKEGKWDRKSFTGVELSGKTLGVVGCGRIGLVVASCAKAMGMKVLGYDPVMAKEGFVAAGITQAVKVDDIWKECDFISFHTPLTPETSNLLNDDSFAKCKKGVRIVNCARGGIVDEAALLRALESGHVAGAALDVYSSEPPKEHLHALLRHPNVVCTPHLGASTDEAQVNVARDIAIQMCDVFDQKDYVGICNVPYMAAATQPHMKPFMMLAEMMGGMLGQMSESPVVELRVKTWGGRDVNIATTQARLLLQAKALKGLVKYIGRAQGLVPDLISAPAMAKELGIHSTISADLPAGAGGESPYWNLVTVEIKRADGTASAMTGAVFGTVPHIVQVDEFSDLFAFKPEGGNILTFRNLDRPGAISLVLEVLHGANINVACVNVARAGSKDATGETKALCFMDLDEQIPTNVLKALKSLTSLSQVANIQL